MFPKKGTSSKHFSSSNHGFAGVVLVCPGVIQIPFSKLEWVAMETPSFPIGHAHLQMVESIALFAGGHMKGGLDWIRIEWKRMESNRMECGGYIQYYLHTWVHHIPKIWFINWRSCMLIRYKKPLRGN